MFTIMLKLNKTATPGGCAAATGTASSTSTNAANAIAETDGETQDGQAPASAIEVKSTTLPAAPQRDPARPHSKQASRSASVGALHGGTDRGGGGCLFDPHHGNHHGNHDDNHGGSHRRKWEQLPGKLEPLQHRAGAPTNRLTRSISEARLQGGWQPPPPQVGQVEPHDYDHHGHRAKLSEVSELRGLLAEAKKAIKENIANRLRVAQQTIKTKGNKLRDALRIIDERGMRLREAIPSIEDNQDTKHLREAHLAIKENTPPVNDALQIIEMSTQHARDVLPDVDGYHGRALSKLNELEDKVADLEHKVAKCKHKKEKPPATPGAP